MKYTEDDVTNNMGLVFMIAKRMPGLTNSGLMEFRDIISEGTLGLIYALGKFDESKGFQFSSFAHRCISGFMLRGHRALHMEHWKAKASRFDVRSDTVSMYQQIPGSDGTRVVVGFDDRGSSARTIFDDINDREIWETLIPILSPRQREMVELQLQDLTQQEIGDRLGVSRQCVSQTINREISKAKKLFAVKEAA